MAGSALEQVHVRHAGGQVNLDEAPAACTLDRYAGEPDRHATSSLLVSPVPPSPRAFPVHRGCRISLALRAPQVSLVPRDPQASVSPDLLAHRWPGPPA